MASRTRTPSWLRSLCDRAAAQPPRAMLDRRQSPPQTFQLLFDREIYLVNLRRHSRARRYTLRIHTGSREVILTMPPRGSVREAKAFAQKHGAWIAARLRRLPEAAPFADGAVLPLRGVAHRVVHRPDRRGSVWIDRDGVGAPLICVAGDEPHLPRRVGDFLRREAQRDLSAASRRAAEAIGVSVKRISVRDQSSRWGSCSSSGVLSYSWRLILAPPFVLDYLAVHEVAHLVEMNHSPRFWRVVHRHCADVERAKAWLDANGADLHRYGVSSVPAGMQPA
jgi:predicted metal-dependent hydrolase